MLLCVAVCCSVLQCVAVYCSVLQCVAVCCSVLQCVAVCCSMSMSAIKACEAQECGECKCEHADDLAHPESLRERERRQVKRKHNHWDPCMWKKTLKKRRAKGPHFDFPPSCLSYKRVLFTWKERTYTCEKKTTKRDLCRALMTRFLCLVCHIQTKLYM